MRPRKRNRSSRTHPRTNKKVKHADTNDLQVESDQRSDAESVSSESENYVTYIDEHMNVCANRTTVTTSSSENNTINSIINSTRSTTDTCTLARYENATH